MPTIDVYNMEGKVCGTLELSDKVFAAQVNGPVIHSVVRAYLLNQRQGTQSTLTRSEVAGGGAEKFPRLFSLLFTGRRWGRSRPLPE